MSEVNRTEYGDIVIGGLDNFVRSTISEVCYESRCVNVSENNCYYWVHTELIDYKLYIIKGCEESEKLEQLMKEQKASKILHFAHELILGNLNPNELVELFMEVKQDQFMKGRMDAQKKIRNALGLE